MSSPLVGIIMGSDSDWPVLQVAAKRLKEMEVPWEARVLSAHRTPDLPRPTTRTSPPPTGYP